MKTSVKSRSKSRTAARTLAAFGLASGLSLSVDRAAEAAIVYSGVQDLQVNGDGTPTGLDVDNNSVIDFEFTRTTVPLSLEDTASVTSIVGNFVVGGGGFADALDAGTPISAASSFVPGIQILGTSNFAKDDSITTGGNFPNAVGKYLGLKFLISGQVHYGWAQINDTVSSLGQSVVIHDWAYESESNREIIAGSQSSLLSPVPEPASLVQLALGAAGLVGLSSARRRRLKSIEAN